MVLRKMFSTRAGSPSSIIYPSIMQLIVAKILPFYNSIVVKVCSTRSCIVLQPTPTLLQPPLAPNSSNIAPNKRYLEPSHTMPVYE